MKKINETAAKQTAEKIISLIESEYESDAAFERETGLAPKTVNNWRRGRSASYMKMLPRLADSFGVSVGELLDMPIGHSGLDLSDDEINLLTLYRKCNVLTAPQRLAMTKTLESVIMLYLNSVREKKGSKGTRGED
ncbi:MAG: hypothetical protein IKD45_04155 [Clostridia bacterium]|nr:hypothetical protein [Clostridia bacterium]